MASLEGIKETDNDEGLEEQEQFAPGDTGENPPEESVNWPKYENVEHDFHFQYPDKYKLIVDGEGWPHAVAHLVMESGEHVMFEVWSEADAAEKEGRIGESVTYFSIVEHPETGEYISIACLNAGMEQDCEDIYRTLSFQ